MDVSPSSLPRKELIYCGRDDAITADGRRAIVDVAAAQPSPHLLQLFSVKIPQNR